MSEPVKKSFSARIARGKKIQTIRGALGGACATHEARVASHGARQNSLHSAHYSRGAGRDGTRYAVFTTRESRVGARCALFATHSEMNFRRAGGKSGRAVR